MATKPLRRPTNPELRDTLVRLKKWPSLKKKFHGKPVRIWSDQWEAYWRPRGGYTADGLAAGVFDFDDAWDRTHHCGPEKKIEFRLLDYVPD